MTPFIIDETVRQRLKHMMEYGQARRLNLHDIFRAQKQAADGLLKPAGHDPGRCVPIPVGYVAVYTVEEQPEMGGWCHHISLLSPNPGRCPTPAAMALLLESMGLKPAADRNAHEMWIETAKDGCGAMHLIFPLERAPESAPSKVEPVAPTPAPPLDHPLDHTPAPADPSCRTRNDENTSKSE